MSEPITMREIKATAEWHDWVEGLEKAADGEERFPTLSFAKLALQVLLLRVLAREMGMTTDELLEEMD